MQRFEGKADQAEGCLVKIKSFPLPAAKTEISLDIGSPSFLYVEHSMKVIRFAPIARGRVYIDAVSRTSRDEAPCVLLDAQRTLYLF
ncbi:hypothetical protein DXT90_06085 [Agrobacterium tumefaciens]|nr:hypothetical protein ASD74_09625 [Rhizobium sp. Root564]MQB20200.1 hypothetical protein [Agrobacterium tumefaciens]